MTVSLKIAAVPGTMGYQSATLFLDYLQTNVELVVLPQKKCCESSCLLDCCYLQVDENKIYGISSVLRYAQSLAKTSDDFC